MYKIGDFSILNDVTIKTLRYYDSIDLFKPAIIDKYTGYRYYSDEQQEVFHTILKYKDLGFSLEEIKILINEDKDNIITKKINDLTLENIENDKKIQRLYSMLSEKSMNKKVEYKPYKTLSIVGKKYTIETRKDIKEKLEEVKKELEKLHIPYEYEIFCNFELGYTEKDMDCLIGYTTSKNLRGLDLGNLIYLGGSPWNMKIVGKGKKSALDEIYKNIVEYAHDNDIQIRDFFTEKYDEENVEIYAEAFNLKETNEDYEFYLNHYNPTKELDENLIGTYQIREILPSMKFMANPSKQKSNLDTRFKEFILNSDGTTNYPNIKWNKNELVMEYDNRLIPLAIHKEKYQNQDYIIILMNETYTNYLSQRPMEYLYKKVK